MKNSTIYRTENVQRYFNDINKSKYNTISDRELRKLFVNRQRNIEKIFNAHIRLVATIAKTYDRGDKFLDFNQVGIEGLIEAINKYNYMEEAKFSTYASYWIKAKMSMLCRDLNMLQRTNHGKIGSKATKFQDQFYKENMRDATTDEIAEFLSEECGVDVQHSSDVLGISVNSINDDLYDNDMTPESCGEFAVRTACENDYIIKMENEDLANAISKLMTILTDKEKEFVTRHIYNGETFADIAEDYGYTAERVRQIVTGSLKKMKKSEYAKARFSCYLK